MLYIVIFRAGGVILQAALFEADEKARRSLRSWPVGQRFGSRHPLIYGRDGIEKNIQIIWMRTS